MFDKRQFVVRFSRGFHEIGLLRGWLEASSLPAERVTGHDKPQKLMEQWPMFLRAFSAICYSPNSEIPLKIE